MMKITEITNGETGNIGFFNWLYKEYGFNVTIEQRRESLYLYLRKFKVKRMEISF